MNKEAGLTSLRIKHTRKRYPNAIIYKQPDMGNKEKRLDVEFFYNKQKIDIEFKYSKNKLSIEQLTKLLQLNQILAIKKVTENGGKGLIGLFYPDGLDLYLYKIDGGREQIGSDIGVIVSDN